MKVLIDGLSAREGGGVTYLSHILPALAAVRPAWEFTVVLSRRYQRSIIERLPEGFRLIDADLEGGALWKRWSFLQTQLPGLARSSGVDVAFSVSETSSVALPCPLVVLVRNPELFPSAGGTLSETDRVRALFYRLTRRFFVRRTLDRAQHLIFVSRSFRDSIGSQGKASSVVYHGLDPSFGPAKGGSAGSREGYFLSVSVMVPHKDFETLLEGFAEFASGRDGRALTLKIAGAAGDRHYERRIRQLALRSPVADRIQFLGHVPHAELPALYGAALASIMPSRLETFGHPLVESMACGAPVVASALPICREICGDAALYFEPGDHKNLARTLREVAGEAATFERLRAAGLYRSRDFSWRKSAADLSSILETNTR